MPPHHSVTIVGAGVIGMTCAACLQRDGHDVTVIDSRAPGEGCSYGNGGAISPGTCVPDALPGMLGRVPGWLVDPLGPLAIRWHYLPRAVPWLLRWMRAGRIDRVKAVAAAMHALHAPALDGWREILGPAGMADLIRQQGQLYVWESEIRGKNEKVAEALRAEHGVRADAVDGATIRELEPALAPIYKRGLLFPGSAQTVNPLRLVQTVAEAVVRDGGRVVRAQVTGFEVGPDGPRKVQTDRGERDLDLLVVAAGAWSHRLAFRLGSRVPLETERGYHVLLPSAGVGIRHKLSNRSRMIGVAQMENGLQLTGTAEIAGVDAPPDYHRAWAVLERGRRMFPGLNAEGATVWMGCRPSLPDTIPVVGRSPRFANVFYAFGHGHYGLSGAPMTSRLIGDLVAGRAPAIDPRPYRIDRF